MEYRANISYVSNPIIEPLSSKNDKLSHKETFDVFLRGNQSQITWYHTFSLKGDPSTIKPSYYDWFNKFLNVNARFIPEGSLAIDIGAADGDTTLPIALCCGKAGLTYAFECGEIFMTNLSINIAANPNLRIIGAPYALMPASGIHEFLYTGKDYNGGHPSTNSWLKGYCVPRLIRAVSFKDYFQNINISRLSFVKVDTEGHDYHILWSFKEALKELRPVIHAEWFPRTDPFIAKVLQYLGYEMFCGFTLEHLVLGKCQWRQDIVLVPAEKAKGFGL